MSRSTGQNEVDLHQILDLIRVSSITILLLHFYYYDYSAFRKWGLTVHLGDVLLGNLGRTGLFRSFLFSKVASLLLLAVSFLGAKGKKEPGYTPQAGVRIAAAGLLLYFASAGLLYLGFPHTHLALLYMLFCSAGYLLILNAGNYCSRIIWPRSQPDIFNRLHESFPQEERLLTNAWSINLRAEYEYKGEVRTSWINLINPFRGTLILGSPGAGKTWFIIQHILKQQIQKGYSMLVYDFKYDDLSRIAYNYFLRYRSNYPGSPGFYSIHFEDLRRSHRCNPLAPSTMQDITDAAESARTILLGLNMEWVGKQGDFFVESSINFVTALIWFLCRYQDGRYCSWPHVIELAQTPYKALFTVLRAESQIEVLVNPFINALHGAMEQLQGQIASATIGLAKLSSPGLYYIMTGNDLSLDLNDPEFPKILTLGNNPQKAGIYGPVMSVYINTINRLANRKGRHPFSEILEEFSTIIVHSIDKSLATGRSNKMAITLAVQDTSQLRLAYGKEFADVILHTCGNVLSGQVSGETAKWLSDRFGKTLQDRESLTLTSGDTSINQSQQLEYSIPVSRIASLSSGEFVGTVADNPDQPIDLKTFCCRIRNDHKALTEEEEAYAELPVIREVTPEMLSDNFRQIKKDITTIVDSEMSRIEATDELEHLVIR